MQSACCNCWCKRRRRESRGHRHPAHPGPRCTPLGQPRVQLLARTPHMGPPGAHRAATLVPAAPGLEQPAPHLRVRGAPAVAGGPWHSCGDAPRAAGPALSDRGLGSAAQVSLRDDACPRVPSPLPTGSLPVPCCSASCPDESTSLQPQAPEARACVSRWESLTLQVPSPRSLLVPQAHRWCRMTPALCPRGLGPSRASGGLGPEPTSEPGLRRLLAHRLSPAASERPLWDASLRNPSCLEASRDPQFQALLQHLLRAKASGTVEK